MKNTTNISLKKILVPSIRFHSNMPKSSTYPSAKQTPSSKTRKTTTSQTQPTVSIHLPTNSGISSMSKPRAPSKCALIRSTNLRNPLKDSVKIPPNSKEAPETPIKPTISTSNKQSYVCTIISRNYKLNLPSSSSTMKPKRKKY